VVEPSSYAQTKACPTVLGRRGVYGVSQVQSFHEWSGRNHEVEGIMGSCMGWEGLEVKAWQVAECQVWWAMGTCPPNKWAEGRTAAKPMST